MNDAQRTPEQLRKLIHEITTEWADRGKLIEGGWWAFQTVIGLEGAPEVQRSAMRQAFMAGAQHLFASIMDLLDPGAEPTDKELKRLELIHAELEAFTRSLK